MTTIKRCFLDTNILIFSTLKDSDFYKMAQEALKLLEEYGIRGAISGQSIQEYYAALTKNVEISDELRNTLVANIEVFLESYEVLDNTRDVRHHFLTLLRGPLIGGKQVHDANIVATMQAHQISFLLTHNTKRNDLTRFGHMINVIPLLQAAEIIPIL